MTEGETVSLSKAYRGVIELIITFIIALSLIGVQESFIPISKLEKWDNFVDLYAILLAYSIVIFGVIGYHQSIEKHPHKGNIGGIRFVVDLTILLLIYYLVAVSNPVPDPNNPIPHDDWKHVYGQTFVWVIPSIFVCYAIWDVLKYFEYRGDTKQLEKGKPVLAEDDDPTSIPFKRAWWSISFCLVLWLMAFIYLATIPMAKDDTSGFSGNDKMPYDLYFMIGLTLLYHGYRIAKMYSREYKLQ